MERFPFCPNVVGTGRMVGLDGRTDGRMAVPRFSLGSDGRYRPGRILFGIVPKTDMNFYEFSIETRSETERLMDE